MQTWGFRRSSPFMPWLAGPVAVLRGLLDEAERVVVGAAAHRAHVHRGARAVRRDVGLREGLELEAQVRAHLDAGANHVCIQSFRADGVPGSDEPLLEELARRLA